MDNYNSFTHGISLLSSKIKKKFKQNKWIGIDIVDGKIQDKGNPFNFYSLYEN